MRYIFTLLAALAVTGQLSAQHKGQFSAGTEQGYSIARFKGNDLVNDDKGGGSFTRAKACVGIKRFEFGFGLEVVVINTNAELHRVSPDAARTIGMAGPATRVVPYLMFNYKQPFRNNTHAFAGVFTGVGITGWRGDQVIAFMSGLQAGYVVPLVWKLDLAASVAWRYMRLDDLYYEDGQNSMHYQPVTINYYMAALGVRLKLGS